MKVSTEKCSYRDLDVTIQTALDEGWTLVSVCPKKFEYARTPAALVSEYDVVEFVCVFTK